MSHFMDLSGKRVIQLVHSDFEDLELWYPVLRLREAGAEVHLVGEEAETTYTGKHGVPATCTHSYGAIDPEAYDCLLVPGGWAPDKLRRFDAVIAMVQHFHQSQKTLGHICHAGWVLVSAAVLSGVTTTSTPGIKDDLENAGAHWVDESATADGHIISAQRPPDLPNYLPLLMAHLAEG